MANINELVGVYVQLRDKKREITDRHKQELAPYNEKLQTIEGFLLKMLGDMGMDSAKTGSGTAYKAVKAQAKVVDREAFMQFCMKEERMDMLTASASKTAIEEYIEDTGKDVPGVQVNRVVTLNVRK